jgi:orotidine-5'-phosphate decarboxylase
MEILISEEQRETSAIIQKLQKRWKEIDSMAGVGIDPDPDKISQEVWRYVGGRNNIADGYNYFIQGVIDSTHPYTVDYKVNSNFFQGEQGRRALKDTFNYLRITHPDIIRICDGKFADIGNTAEKIAQEIFGNLDADAVLLNPYMGRDAIEPFTRWKDKLIIMCVNTSNGSASEIQDLPLANGELLWKHILKLTMQEWNYNNNIIPVLSATHPHNLEGLRTLIGDSPILLAGVGTQGGNLSESIPYCLDRNGYGLMISSSRGILYPDDRKVEEPFFDASRRAIIELKNSINTAKQSYLISQNQ